MTIDLIVYCTLFVYNSNCCSEFFIVSFKFIVRYGVCVCGGGVTVLM